MFRKVGLLYSDPCLLQLHVCVLEHNLNCFCCVDVPNQSLCAKKISVSYIHLQVFA